LNRLVLPYHSLLKRVEVWCFHSYKIIYICFLTEFATGPRTIANNGCENQFAKHRTRTAACTSAGPTSCENETLKFSRRLPIAKRELAH
jgi:hypothetical protein